MCETSHHSMKETIYNRKITYKLAKNFSLVIDGDRVPENPLEARLLQISRFTN